MESKRKLIVSIRFRGHPNRSLFYFDWADGFLAPGDMNSTSVWEGGAGISNGGILGECEIMISHATH